MNLHNAEFVRSVTAVADCPKDGLPQIAFAGKSNVGKASVINGACRSIYSGISSDHIESGGCRNSNC